MLVVLHSLRVLQVVTPITSQIFLGKSSIKPPGGLFSLFILSPFERGLTETGAYLRGGGAYLI